MTASSGFAESDGLRIHYEDSGEGHPVLLVHGWGASVRSNWREPGWIEALEAAGRAVALDVRGHGDSDKPYEPYRYSYAEMAHDVVAVMDHLGIARADLVGHSLGAFCGVDLLGRHPDRLRSVVLMGVGDETEASIAEAPAIAAALRAPALEDVEDPLGRLFRRYVDADPRNDREALAVAALQMWPEGFPRTIGGSFSDVTDTRVLILNGADDVPYAATGAALAAAIPGARLVEIPGGDHLGPVTDPRFKREALGFLMEAA